MNQPINKAEQLEASGIHFIGEHDPRTMPPEDFEKSPDILYHWAGAPFSYMQHFDSNIPEYFLEDKNKETLGQGFYATSDKSEAEVRSVARQGVANTLPILLSLLPFQLRVFDFRDRTNPAQNGPVPSSLAERWLQFFTDYYHASNRENLPWTTTGIEDRYYLYLKEVIRMPRLDLRVMLGTVPFPQSPATPNPPWSKVFANFVIREGVEGIIYNEQNFTRQGITSPIFVFYNLSKLGTFESWKNPQVAALPQRPT